MPKRCPSHRQPDPRAVAFNELRQHPMSVRLGSYRAQVLYWGFLGHKWWRNYLHTHSFFEICYASGGRGTFRMLGRDYEVQGGDVFIAKPSEPHQIIASRADPLVICFWGYTLVPAPARQESDHAVDALLDAFAASKTWVSRRVGDMPRTLELLTREILEHQPGYVQAIEGLTTKLLLETARSVVESAPAPRPPRSRDSADPVVQTALRYLRDNYARAIGVREVAAQVHLSERHLARLFARQMGQSILQYLTTIRIEAAKQLLLDRDKPVKQIATACGYPDVHYFTTLFKRTTGQTPARYRETGGTRFLRS